MPQASILIADDNTLVRETLRAWLSATFPACRVLEAEGGREAVNLALSHSPGVIVMDLRMPRMNGLEAVRRIKAVHPQSRIVIYTIHAEWIYREQAFAAGADAFVAKEEGLEGLMTVIRQGLPNAPRSAQSGSEQLRNSPAAAPKSDHGRPGETSSEKGATHD